MIFGNIHWYLFSYFKLWTRHEVNRAQAYTICTAQIHNWLKDNNSHRKLFNGVGGGTTGLKTLVR